MQTYANPYAPPALNGVNDPYPYGFVDIPYSYVFNITLSTTAIQANQSIPIDDDSDFVWRALVVGAGSGFNFRFIDAHGVYLSNTMLSSALLSTTAQAAFPIFPELIFPAGGRIGLDIQTDAPTAIIQLIFMGAKRFRLSQ